VPDIEITSVDLAAGIRASNLTVPAMVVNVALKNPSVALQRAIKDDKLIVQKMAMAAFDRLQQAREAVAGAIGDIDRNFAKNPPADKAEAEDRVRTLNAMCRKVAEAQGAAATAAAEAAWNKYVKQNRQLTRMEVVFALKMALDSISIAASVAAAALSLGTLAATLVGAALNVASMAGAFYDFARSIDTVEADIRATDKVIAAAWTNDTITAGKVGRELAARLGVPIVKSIGGMSDLLKELNAKNAAAGKMGDRIWTESKKLIAMIGNAPERGSPAQKKILEAAGQHTDELLDRIGELSKLAARRDRFYAAFSARCAVYRAMEGKELPMLVDATEGGAVIYGICSTLKTIGEIVSKLA
jgi:hypothetical protein